MIWRSAMPLLTTLAALVIIVHSAEEDLETEYRHDLRPRTLDTGTQRYDQPWRAMEADHAVQPLRNTENLDAVSPDELPKRPRPGRKRKRRPQTISAEDPVPQDIVVYPEASPRPLIDVDSEKNRQTTEMPKRRRKKIERRPIRLTDDVVDLQRGIRRRVQRRKRPSLETWPELSEFRHTSALIQHGQVEAKTESINQVNFADIREENPPEGIRKNHKNAQDFTEQRISDMKLDLQHASHAEFPLPVNDGEDNVVPKRIFKVEDKSVSEFSSEVLITARRPTKEENNPNLSDYNNKSSGIFNEFDKAQDSYLMDPLTLKDILKRSNGTSLSEILQQHNLSLTDLLRGKQHAVSLFKSGSFGGQNTPQPITEISKIKQDLEYKDESEEQAVINSETKHATEPVTEYFMPEEIETEPKQKDANEPITTAKPLEENTANTPLRRRFPPGIRKKLRIRPLLNNTYKVPVNTDLMALNARKYSRHRRILAKPKEWKNAIPSMAQNITHNEKNNTMAQETTTLGTIPEVTTIPIEGYNSSSQEIMPDDDIKIKIDNIDMDMRETTTIYTIEMHSEISNTATEKPTVISMLRPTMNSSNLRRQAFSYRLKRKRLKHKNVTTEPPQDDIIKHLFGLGNLVSSSEFIARTQEPKTTDEDSRDSTTLDDFITTESTRKTESEPLTTKTGTIKIVTIRDSTTPLSITSTEETAKIEIEDILNDTRTSAILSKILMERNMTLSELFEHRERGSSHIHLADIFHNASREPNPPEPFLSKSLLEPISKETYPLRALLDANSHDPNGKATIVDPSAIGDVNIPVVMDFRNNVNENAENMGIMSLFNNVSKPANKTTLLKDSQNRTYKPSIIPINVTNIESETVRESRTFNEFPDDVVSWNEIFSLMGRNHQNDTTLQNPEELSPVKPFTRIRLDEDADGDGLIVLEDLQHLKDFENNIASDSDEKIIVNAFENKETPQQGSGILDKIPSQTKSVTVATASIAGLAMILFLLTYAAFKWKQQRSEARTRHDFGDERIPTPVFENRKGHKNNSSTRSISPMLQTSNIYTLNTLDSQNGKDSPDYMWDSMRKPFQ